MKAFCPVKEVSWILPVSPYLGVVHNLKKKKTPPQLFFYCLKLFLETNME